jgi:PAS domain S-box-containing protein
VATADGDQPRSIDDAAQEMQARLQILADNLPHAMIYQIAASADDRSRRFTFLGRSCERINGVTAEAALADPGVLYDLFSPEDRARVAAAEAAARAEMKPFDLEVAIVRPDGERRWCRLSSAPRLQPDGSTVWDGIQLDITESRMTRDALEREQTRLSLAVDATGLGLWDYDLRTGALHWSDAVRTVLGLPPELDVTYEAYVQCLHPEDRERVLATYQEAIASGADGYKLEHRALHPDGTVRWLLGSARIVRDADGQPLRLYGSTLDITRRKQSEEHLQFMLHELNHRVKNAMSVVQAVVAQTLRHSQTPPETREQLRERLMALSRTHDLLTEGAWTGADLTDVAVRSLRAIGGEPPRLTIEGPSVRLRPSTALSLSMVFHELGTNAAKYGALSAEAGRVRLAWSLDPERGRLSLVWQETGGPEVRPPERRGFGMQLIERGLSVELGGTATLDFRPEGLVCSIEGSVDRVGPPA